VPGFLFNDLETILVLGPKVDLKHGADYFVPVGTPF